MGRFRYAILEQDKAETSSADGGTITIDLPEKGILSELTFQARALGAYSNDCVTPMHAILEKIELLVDGSSVVKSLTGTQVKALDWYNGGPFSLSDDSQFAQNDNVYYHDFPLYLGRFAGDTKYGLDMGAYANPQLKVTWNTSLTTFDGMTLDAHTDPTFTHSTIAKMIDGTPTGFTNMYMQSREIDTWDNANSAQHNTEIPRGFDLWGIMHRAAYLNINPEQLINKVDLDFDNGIWNPIDMNYAQFWSIYKTWFPKPCVVTRTVAMAEADHFDTRLMNVQHVDVTDLGATSVHGTLTSARRPIGTIKVVTASNTTNTNASTYWTQCTGFGPHQTLYIPMRQLVDGDLETVRTTDYSRIDFKTTTGSAAGTSGQQKLVAEYLKPNGR
ncbi:hypothetical protein LCGC14_1079240 [marine sediment metagenome]|uniref:Uncharacterized protein n=1 Tax=marine sediment metagenome TaxID=412755 RepID=A0A0F9PYV7_9ZZZZ